MKKFLTKLLLCLVIFLSLLILSKQNSTYREKIKKAIYEDHLEFNKIKQIYNHYLGGIFPLELIKISQTQKVFSEEMTYHDIKKYKDGAELIVTSHTMIPAINAGIVVYIGEKDDYGKTVIIENDNSIDLWYGNICDPTIKLYDQIQKGDYIGQACNDKIYFVVTKENQPLNYKNYLK